jgi:hypothetical protein
MEDAVDFLFRIPRPEISRRSLLYHSRGGRSFGGWFENDSVAHDHPRRANLSSPALMVYSVTILSQFSIASNILISKLDFAYLMDYIIRY